MERRTEATQAADHETYKDAFGRVGPRGGKPKNEPVNGVSAASLVPLDFEHIVPPYLHLMLGLTNDVVKEIYKDLTQLGSTDPKKVEAALQRRMKMAELELLIANAVDDLVGQLGSDARDLVDRIVEGMATATEDEDAAASVAAPRAGGRVMVGEVAKADWKELKDFADTCGLEVMRDAEARAQTLRDGTYRSERDQLKNGRPLPTHACLRFFT